MICDFLVEIHHLLPTNFKEKICTNLDKIVQWRKTM